MEQNNKEKEKNLWNDILSEQLVETGVLSQYNILMVGNKNSGKRSLIKKLQELSSTYIPDSEEDENENKEKKTQVSALDYHYIDVKNFDDSDNEVLTKLSLFIMDDFRQKEMLNLVIDEKFIQSMMLVLVLDLDTIETMMDTITNWIEILATKMSSSISSSIYQDLRDKITRYIKLFREPEFDENNKLVTQILSEEEIISKERLELPEGTLQMNLGIPIIFVLNKSDLMSKLEEKIELTNLVQYELRKQCLTYGSSLLFTSCKENWNIKTLYDYILHRCYSFPLKIKSESINRNQIFIPSGYDNLTLVENNFQTLNTNKPLSAYFDNAQAEQKQKNQLQELKIETEEEFIEYMSKEVQKDVQISQVKEQQNRPTGTQFLGKFYEKLMNQGGKIQKPNEQSLRKKVEQEFTQKIGKVFIKDNEEKARQEKIKEIFNSQKQ